MKNNILKLTSTFILLALSVFGMFEFAYGEQYAITSFSDEPKGETFPQTKEEALEIVTQATGETGVNRYEEIVAEIEAKNEADATSVLDVPHMNDSLIVELASDVTCDDINRLLSSLPEVSEAVVSENNLICGWAIVDIPSGTDIVALISALEKHPDVVKSAYPNYVYKMGFSDN